MLPKSLFSLVDIVKSFIIRKLELNYVTQASSRHAVYVNSKRRLKDDSLTIFKHCIWAIIRNLKSSMQSNVYSTTRLKFYALFTSNKNHASGAVHFTFANICSIRDGTKCNHWKDCMDQVRTQVQHFVLLPSLLAMR